MIKQYPNISSIIGQYDAFIVDLWGVIHDGIKAYPGVIDCLKQMKRANKEIIFLSNAPRRAEKAIEGLLRVGVDASLYDHIVTSGDITHQYIESDKHGYGNKYYMIGPERDAGLLDGTKYERVLFTKDADFVVVTGFDNDESVIKDVYPDLKNSLKYKLPMICANPDLVVVRQTGVRALCAGVIAQEYKKMGGHAWQFGKPYKEVYFKALSLLDRNDLSRIAAIGDNLETDILGANKREIDSYLVAGGILGEKLKIKHGQLPDQKKLESLCKKQGIFPYAVLPEFIW